MMARDRSNDGDWCILRTSGGRTIPLARSLADAGVEAWTPIQVQTRRRPRSKKTIDFDMPIAPTFVFVRAAYVPELMKIMMLPVSPHPTFSIFRHGGGVPLIADREIAGMRGAEEMGKSRTRKAKRHFFANGTRVSVPGGSFAGMTGVVEDGDGKFAMVSFGGGFRVKIASWLLETNQVHEMKAA